MQNHKNHIAGKERRRAIIQHNISGNASVLTHKRKLHCCYFSKEALNSLIEDDPDFASCCLLVIPGIIDVGIYDDLTDTSIENIKANFENFLKKNSSFNFYTVICVKEEK
jgi:hypothetical protein